jgi:hypothetical protein
MTMPYAKVDGLEMYYEVHGTARDGRRPLVPLHGGVTVDLSFGTLLPAPAADRHLVAPELQATAAPPTPTAS